MLTEENISRILYDDHQPLNWSVEFGADQSVEVELGSGTGRFIVDCAARFPRVNFVGIEKSGKWLGKTARRALRQQLPNIRLFRTDSAQFLRENIPPASVQNFHIHFPDPWWKTRHWKRRIFQTDFCANLNKGLIPGGHVHIMTDVAAYFKIIVAIMDEHSGLKRIEFVDDPERIVTNYEEKALKTGGTIYKVRYWKAC